MAVVHDFATYEQLYEYIQATGTFNSVAEAIEAGVIQQDGYGAFQVISGGAGSPVIDFTSALEASKDPSIKATLASIATGAVTIAKQVAQTVEYSLVGLATIEVPTAVAMCAPLAGVAIGDALYRDNPSLWTKISQKILPYCYAENKIQAYVQFMLDPRTGVFNPVMLIPTAIISMLTELFEEEGVHTTEIKKYESQEGTITAVTFPREYPAPAHPETPFYNPDSTTAFGFVVHDGNDYYGYSDADIYYRSDYYGGTYDTLYSGFTQLSSDPINWSGHWIVMPIVEMAIQTAHDIIYGGDEEIEEPTPGVTTPTLPEWFPSPDNPWIIVIPETPSEPEKEVPTTPLPLPPYKEPLPLPPHTEPEEVPDPTPEEPPESWPEEEPWPTIVPWPIQPTEPDPDLPSPEWPDPSKPEVMPWPLPPERPEEWPETPPENWPTTPKEWPEEWPEEVPWPESPEDWPEEAPWPETPPEWWPEGEPWPETPEEWPETFPWPMPPEWPIPWPDDLPYPWPYPYPEPTPDPYPDPKDEPEEITDPWPYPWPYPWPDPDPKRPTEPTSPIDPYRDPSQPKPTPTPEPREYPDPVDPYPTPPTGEPDPPIPPIIPLPFSSTTGLISVYHPTQSELLSFAQWLWVTWHDATIDKIWNNPFDGVITLFELYCTPTDVGRKNIRSGFLDSGVSSETISRYTSIDCGSIAVPEYYGNYFDYAPYSKCHIYLPFIGIVELNVDDIVGHGVNVTYRIDEYNGSCIAMITCAKSTIVNGVEVDYSTVVYQFSGNCAVELPLAGGSQAAIKAGMMEAAAWGIGSVIGGILGGNSLGEIGQGLAYGAASAVHSVVSAKSSVQHSGSFGSSYGAMGAKIPYIIITRPKQIQVPNYNEHYGYQAHKMVRIGDCEGYIRCREVHVISPTASDEEKAQIEQLLKMGVYVTE